MDWNRRELVTWKVATAMLKVLWWWRKLLGAANAVTAASIIHSARIHMIPTPHSAAHSERRAQTKADAHTYVTCCRLSVGP